MIEGLTGPCPVPPGVSRTLWKALSRTARPADILSGTHRRLGLNVSWAGSASSPQKALPRDPLPPGASLTRRLGLNPVVGLGAASPTAGASVGALSAPSSGWTFVSSHNHNEQSAKVRSHSCLSGRSGSLFFNVITKHNVRFSTWGLANASGGLKSTERSEFLRCCNIRGRQSRPSICCEVDTHTCSLSLRTRPTCRLQLAIELTERSITYSTYRSTLNRMSSP